MKQLLCDRLTHAMAFTVIGSPQTKSISQRCGQKLGLDGIILLVILFSFVFFEYEKKLEP